MLTRVANLPDQTVRYLEAGSGRALVLIHAFPLSADMWLPQLQRAAPGWRVIAPDLRGFRGATGGPSGAPLDGVTVDTYARDVLALMSHLDVREAVIAGLSMGGYIALALHRLAPARMLGLVLANTRAGADSAEGRQGREKMIELVGREGAAGVATAMLPKLLGATSQREQPDLTDAVRAMIEANPPDAIAAAIRAMRDRPDSTPGLPAIKCPVRIIAGEEDVIIPLADAQAMHAAIPKSELVVLPRIGHLSNLEGDGSLFHRNWPFGDTSPWIFR